MQLNVFFKVTKQPKDQKHSCYGVKISWCFAYVKRICVDSAKAATFRVLWRCAQHHFMREVVTKVDSVKSEMEKNR